MKQITIFILFFIHIVVLYSQIHSSDYTFEILDEKEENLPAPFIHRGGFKNGVNLKDVYFYSHNLNNCSTIGVAVKENAGGPYFAGDHFYECSFKAAGQLTWREGPHSSIDAGYKDGSFYYYLNYGGGSGRDAVFNCILNPETELEVNLRGAGSLWAYNLFGNVQSLRKISIEWLAGQGAFRDCKNLQYASINFIKENNWEPWDFMDMFLGCSGIEVIRFTVTDMPTDLNVFNKMFHSNYDCTGSYYYPKLKAIVVPDSYVNYTAFTDHFKTKVCRALAEGTCRFISESEFQGKKLQSLSFSSTVVNMDLGAEVYAQVPTFNPANAWNKNVSYSSSNSSVAEITSSGVIRSKSLGSAVITATGEYGHTASYTVNVTGEGVPVRYIYRDDSQAKLTYDTYTNILYVAPPNSSTTKITWTDNSVLESIFTPNNSFHGVIIEQGVTEVVCANSCLINRAVDFIYLPPSCSKLRNLYSKEVDWLFIMSRSSNVEVLADMPAAKVSNCVFNGLYIVEEPGGSTSGKDWLDKITNFYCSTRAKSMFDTYLPSKATTRNLADIPYLTLFEDIKNKAVSLSIPHQAEQHVVDKYRAKSICKTSSYFIDDNESILEVDPVSRTVYLHAEREDGGVAPNFSKSTKNLISETISNMILMPSFLSTVFKANFGFNPDANIGTIYVSPEANSVHNIATADTKDNAFTFNNLIFGGPTLNQFSNYPISPKNIVFTGDLPANPIEGATYSDPKIYAKNNLAKSWTRYTLDAFDMLSLIKDFNTVSPFAGFTANADPVDLSLTCHVTSTARTLEPATPATVKVTPAPLNIPFEPVSAQITGTDNIELKTVGSTEFELKAKASYSSASLVITYRIPTGRTYVVSVKINPPAVTLRGEIESCKIRNASDLSADLTGKTVTLLKDSVITLTAEAVPAELTPRTYEWYCAGVPVSNAKDCVFTPAATGTYQIECFVNSIHRAAFNISAVAPVTLTDTTFSALQVGGFNLTPVFTPGNKNYTVFIPDTVESVTVTFNKQTSQTGYAPKVTRLPSKDAPEFLSGSAVPASEFPVTLYIFPAFPAYTPDFGQYTVSTTGEPAIDWNRSYLNKDYIGGHAVSGQLTGFEYSFTNNVIHVDGFVYDIEGNYYPVDRHLDAGDNFVPVTVRNSPGDTGDFIFNFKREPFTGGDIKLQYGTVNSDGLYCSVDSGLNPGTNNITLPRKSVIKDLKYQVHVETPCKFGNLSAPPVDLGSGDHGFGLDLIGTGRLTVSNGYDVEYVYDINFAYGVEVMPVLTALDVGHPLEPAFNPDVFKYRVHVDNTVSSVDINASAYDDTWISAPGGISLPDCGGTRSVDIIVDDGYCRNTYSLLVIREGAPFVQTTLSGLQLLVNGINKLTPAFDSQIFEYEVTFPQFATLFLDYTAANPEAKCYPPPQYVNGSAETVHINVSAACMPANRYTVKLNKIIPSNMEQIKNRSVTVKDNWIEIDSQSSETITVYTATGHPVLKEIKPAGKFKFKMPENAHTVLLVKADTGWCEKILSR